jgi:hypothetical protein
MRADFSEAFTTRARPSWQSLELVACEPNGFLIANLPTAGLINVFTFAMDGSGTVTLFQQGLEIGHKGR